jgi:hypothetical protein
MTLQRLGQLQRFIERGIEMGFVVKTPLDPL